jgi:hypothetical protein
MIFLTLLLFISFASSNSHFRSGESWCVGSCSGKDDTKVVTASGQSPQTTKIMFLFDWWYDILAVLGNHQQFLASVTRQGLYHKKTKILFLGLDNAGKSTLLYMLKEGKLALISPSLRPSPPFWKASQLILDLGYDEVILGKLSFQIFDLGGHEIG